MKNIFCFLFARLLSSLILPPLPHPFLFPLISSLPSLYPRNIRLPTYSSLLLRNYRTKPLHRSFLHLLKSTSRLKSKLNSYRNRYFICTFLRTHKPSTLPASFFQLLPTTPSFFGLAKLLTFSCPPNLDLKKIYTPSP